MAKKKKKEKVIYYDDNSTVSDMTNVRRRTEGKTLPPSKSRATFKEKWKTYWRAVRMMLVPMCIVLGILAVLFLLLMLVSGNLF